MPRAFLPPHIIKQRQMCFARVSVPVKLQPIVGRKEFKISTGESDPWKAAAKNVAMIAEWKERIEQARNAAQDPLRARVEALTNAYRQYRNKALDDAGAALAMDVLVFALEREGGQLTTALARQPDVRLALASPTIIDQITGHATPFLTHFKRWKEATHIKGDTLKMYVSDIEQFAATVDAPIEQLSRRHLKQWEESLRGKVTAETIRRKMTSVRAYWTWMDEHQLVPEGSQPFASVKIRDKRNKAERAEAKRQRWPVVIVPELWHAAGAKGWPNLAIVTKIGAYTGARINSICCLKVGDVRTDPDTGIRFLHFKDKTQAGVRDVPLHSVIVALIDELVANADEDGYLFHINAKRRGNEVGRDFTALKRELGFDDPRLVFHSIRHTISHMLETAECPEGVAQDIVGHVKRGMTFGTYSGMTRLDHRAMWLEKAVVYPTD